jgi:hypothetical protein
VKKRRGCKLVFEQAIPDSSLEELTPRSCIS